jgi:prepilin-type N-terminal cleavage/methylation domain-containing protein
MNKRHFEHRRRGFTLVEILVVVGIILFLMTISVIGLRNAVGLARQRQTEATILKVHGLIQQRMDAFYRAMERTNLQQANDKLRWDWLNKCNIALSEKVTEVLTKKKALIDRFPQCFRELDPDYPLSLSNPTKWSRVTAQAGVTYVPGKHNPVTESAALLYWIITNSEVYGVGPVDESEFSSSEVRDTDGDGLMEFVDGWGRPLRYYRCPTHLFRPGDGTGTFPPGVNSSADTLSPTRPNVYVTALWSGLPAPPTISGELDPLARDPDDPTGQLWRFAKLQPAVMRLFQNSFGTPGTYNAFLIMSAGPDGVLGLLEPSNEDVFTTPPPLGGPQGQGRLGALTSWAAIQNNPINDNITNRKR